MTLSSLVRTFLLGTALTFVWGCSSTVVLTDAAADHGGDATLTDASADTPVTCGTTTCSGGQVCCSQTLTCYDPACLACCMERNDAGRLCTSAAQCNASEDCIFATVGCRAVGTCETRLGCGRPSLPYCGCDGVTFGDTCEGPGAPWASMGACPDAGVHDAGQPVDVITADSGGGACTSSGGCPPALSCCGSACKNVSNDPLNCGACGHACGGATSMCLGGTCQVPSCAPACGSGQTCCLVQEAGPVGPPRCYDGITCPVGCPACL